MDQELKAYLDAMEARLNAQTAALEKRLNAQSAGLEERLNAQSAGLEERLRAHTEEVETNLLSEFWKWARTADARYRQHQGVVGGLDQRVQAVEDRVAELERRRA
jgi:hypothetical protein